MTTTAQIASPHRSIPPRMPVPDRIRRLAGPIALVAGSVLTVTGMSLHVKEVAVDESLVRAVTAHPSQWLASHLLQSFGMALVAIGALSLWRLARGRGATLTAAGAAVVSAGGGLMALGDVAHGAVAYALIGKVDDTTSLAIQKAYFDHPAILLLSLGGMLLPAGVLVLGAGVLRSGVVPRWTALVLLLSPIAIQIAFVTAIPMAVLGLLFVVGMAGLARSVARS